MERMQYITTLGLGEPQSRFVARLGVSDTHYVDQEGIIFTRITRGKALKLERLNAGIPHVAEEEVVPGLIGRLYHADGQPVKAHVEERKWHAPFAWRDEAGNAYVEAPEGVQLSLRNFNRALIRERANQVTSKEIDTILECLEPHELEDFVRGVHQQAGQVARALENHYEGLCSRLDAMEREGSNDVLGLSALQQQLHHVQDEAHRAKHIVRYTSQLACDMISYENSAPTPPPPPTAPAAA